MTEAIKETFTRDPLDPSVMVLDGHDVTLRVHKKELIAEDGMCGHRRVRKIPRASRDIRRIVVIAHAGNITLEALKFVRDISTNTNETRSTKPTSLIVVEPNGELLCTSARSATDNKLLRAQALMADRPAALDITKYLLGEKFLGRGAVLADWDATPWLEKLNKARTFDQCGSIESNEANAYWEQWIGTPIELKGRSIPDGWRHFLKRHSHLNPNKPRNASDPINAMLNYAYGVAKAETTLACYIHGLEPGLGFNHADCNNAHALVMDLVEAIRPNVEKYVRDLVESRVFDRDLFHEKANGNVRVLRPLTHELSEHALQWHHDMKPVIRHVTSIIRDTINGWQPSRKREAGTDQKTGRKPRTRKTGLKVVS